MNKITLILIALISGIAITETTGIFFQGKRNHFANFFLIIFSVCPELVFFIFNINISLFLLIKFSDFIVLSILITEEISSKIPLVFFMVMMLWFSVTGFSIVIIYLLKNIIGLFSENKAIFSNILVIFAIFIYCFLLFSMFKKLSENEIIKNYLYNVSFLFCGKHIEIIGLADSGNSLCDQRTGIPIIIISLETLSLFIKKSDFIKIKNQNYDDMNYIGNVTCTGVGGQKTELPVFNIGGVKLKQREGSHTKYFICELAITKEKFNESGDYDCLLHRDCLK